MGDIAVLVQLAFGVWVIGVCFAKGKPGFGIAGIFLFIFAIVGAIRIAKPDSWWDRNKYEDGGGKHKLARKRF